MAVVDTSAVPEIEMRVGVTGRWLAGHAQGASGTSVLRNWLEPRLAVPRHIHECEEILIVEQGEMWVEIDGVRQALKAGQTAIIPPRTAHAWGTFDGKAQVLFVWPAPDPFGNGMSTYLDGPPPAVA